MFIRLLILVTLLPVLEIWVLIESGRAIGAWPTVALVILTGIAGSWLMRQQGVELLGKIQREMAAGRVPAGALLDGALVLAGGLLLLTPGFCTDLAGFTMLVPVTRRFWRGWLTAWLAGLAASGRLTIRRF